MADHAPPIVVDLGKVKRKRVKELRKGQGPLVEEVNQVMANVRESLGEDAAGKELVPVVILYRRRPKRRRTIFSL